MNEWHKSSLHPQNKEELFNLRHSSLRNVIERVFGVLKMQFPLLTAIPKFPFEFQVDLVMCVLLVHNFIKKENIEEAYNIKIWEMLKKVFLRAKEVKDNVDDLTK